MKNFWKIFRFQDRAECKIDKKEGIDRSKFDVKKMRGIFIIVYTLVALSLIVLLFEWIFSCFQLVVEQTSVRIFFVDNFHVRLCRKLNNSF